MQLIITDAWLAKSRALHLSGTKLLGAMVLASFVLMLVAAGLYHWVFLKGAREGWPVVGTLVRLMVNQARLHHRHPISALPRQPVEIGQRDLQFLDRQGTA